MVYDFKKEHKEQYQPGTQPSLINVPAATYLVVDGAGDPNTSPEYAAAVELLYGLSYGIKMGHKAVLDYVVPPLEGFWSVGGDFRGGGAAIPDKGRFVWTMCIRQPDFVTEAILDAAKASLARKKPGLDVQKARLKTINEGLCVQVLHIGPYDAEPATIAALDTFAKAQGYVIDINDARRHHEIYLSDPRKTAPEKLKTILRHPVRPLRVEQKQYLTQADADHIRALQRACEAAEPVALKLELDFKLADAAAVASAPATGTGGMDSAVDEFFCYEDGQLAGYLGICSFAGIIDPPELSGMVHPDRRRQGIFTQLLGAALEECGRRNAETVLLLCDRNSGSGQAFLARLGANYEYSEYEMRLGDTHVPNEAPTLEFRKSRTPEDLEEETKGMTTWFAERDGTTVGVVRLQLTNGTGGIYGLEVDEAHRGKGYGRAILQHSVALLKAASAAVILLQVETGNEIALGLYRSCGFAETTTMDYFSFPTAALRK